LKFVFQLVTCYVHIQVQRENLIFTATCNVHTKSTENKMHDKFS